VNGQTPGKRWLLDNEASRRAFLRGVAAAGVGTAIAALWDPTNVAHVGAARTKAASRLSRGGTGGGRDFLPMDGGGTRAQASDDQSVWMAHLLRRTGFAATAADLQTYVPLGLSGAVDKLLNYDQTPDTALDYANNAGLDLTKVADAIRWWLLRMTYTSRPLQEKLTLFWHGILTSGVSKIGARYLNTLLAQNEFLRANATGTYDTLLKGISRDPAMMVWLDLQTNSKAHPNENFARELMELFSLGIGHYSEDDVRESARAFTGYQLDKDRHFVYNAKNHDDGQKTFLGQTGTFGGDQVIDVILQQRAAAEYISTRLWSYFAYPNPEPEVVKALADTFQQSNYSIKATLKQLFTLPQFYSDTAYQALIKRPAEFVVGAARGLNLSTDAAGFPQYMVAMGQTLFDPPNVAGWPDGAYWLSSASFFARMNFLNVLAYAKNGPDPSALFGDYTASAVDDAIDLAASRFLSMPLSGGSADAIQQFLSDSNGGGAAITGKNVRSFIYLVLATPENQLA
jgi:uncharacterized protein (DUF1800 family)